MRPSLRPLVALVLAIPALAVPALALGQDIEALGYRYGTEPPQAYWDQRAADPGAFEFSRGLVPDLAARFSWGIPDAGRPRILGPRSGPVTGSYRIPVVMGLFGDSPSVDSMRYGAAEVQPAYFGAGVGTITDFYDELSGGRVQLIGDVMDWTRAATTQSQATGGESGLRSGTTGVFITRLLERLDGVDWGLYDNDGPDGVPNSGDDDGFVDVLAVIQPTPGAECGGTFSADRIWSHRWTLRAASGSAFVTTVPSQSASVAFVTIDDYTVQPIFACNNSDLSEIGVVAHELGHAFGLPDLYDTRENIDGKHAGAGNWDLMSSGSWGCDGSTPEQPCHMGAWSKAVLGWTNIVTLTPDQNHGTVSIQPVETGGTVYRIDAADGSGEYFLLENRQRLGYDQNLFAEGLLVWHIDPDWVAARWGSNAVNAYEHRGVWLRQADGKDQLGQIGGGGRGDPGDPFPFVQGGIQNREFHAASSPAARSWPGTATGLTLTDIQISGDVVTLQASTRFTRVTVRSIGDSGGGGLFRVDGAAISTPVHTFVAAPFATHEVEAMPGDVVSPGVRRPFLRWSDSAEADLARTVVIPLQDTELVSEYGGRQVELAIASTGGSPGIEPGTFRTNPSGPDLWFAEGVPVTIEAVPTPGFAFLGWAGALAGQPNPATVTLTGPTTAEAGFEQTFAVLDQGFDFPAATMQALQLATSAGTLPTMWAMLDGDLPVGIHLLPDGRLTGAALETGSYDLTVRAQDGRGLTAEGVVTLVVAAPSIDPASLTQLFVGIGTPLDQPQRDYLDRQGNGNGIYDLGDLRAYVLANPQTPFTASVRALAGRAGAPIVGRGEGR